MADQGQDNTGGVPGSGQVGATGDDYGGYEDEPATSDQPATSGTGVYGAQESFNNAMGITAENPYGKQGFFTRVLGIPPENINYSNIMDAPTRLAIANNQFSKFANPQNVPGQLGYNPEFPTAPPGELRPGVQSKGYMTAFGPVMGQFAEQSNMDMAARGLMGLLGGPVGMLAGQLGTQEYGIPGMPGFESFDPNNPRGPQSMLGNIASAFTGGVDPTQAAAAAAAMGQDIADFFSPEAPAPAPAAQEQGFGQSLDSFEDTKAARTNAGISGVLESMSFAPVMGVPEQDVRSTNPLGYQKEATLVDPTDMYGMLTKQLAQPATPYSALSMQQNIERNLSKGMAI